MKKVYLIGRSLKHSISPFIHNKIFSHYNIDAVYENVELPEEKDLGRFIEDIKKDEDILGFNVTIPYKENILKYCDELSEDVEIIRAANTIKNENGRLIAYNTDWMGFMKSLNENSVAINGKKILVLGAGGAAKACIYGLYKMGIDEIFLSNRTQENAQKIKEQLNGFIRVNLVDWDKVDSFPCHVLINTTPIGMFPKFDESPLKKLNSEMEIVYDMIYNPYKTRLLQMADDNGIVAINGMKMLIYQAIEADMIWLDINPDGKLALHIEKEAKAIIESYYE